MTVKMTKGIPLSKEKVRFGTVWTDFY